MDWYVCVLDQSIQYLVAAGCSPRSIDRCLSMCEPPPLGILIKVSDVDLPNNIYYQYRHRLPRQPPHSLCCRPVDRNGAALWSRGDGGGAHRWRRAKRWRRRRPAVSRNVGQSIETYECVGKADFPFDRRTDASRKHFDPTQHSFETLQVHAGASIYPSAMLTLHSSRLLYINYTHPPTTTTTAIITTRTHRARPGPALAGAGRAHLRVLLLRVSGPRARGPPLRAARVRQPVRG